MSENIKTRTSAVSPKGFNHLVLNVRNMEESHHFWSDLLGFRQVGSLKPKPEREKNANMRFYSGVQNETVNHHDLALVEVEGMPMADKWTMGGSACAINHMAITYPNRESWLEQVKFLQSQGALKEPIRADHGMTHSVYVTDPNGYKVEVLYDLPEEVWENDIDAALNYVDYLDEEDLLTDNTDYKIFGTSGNAS